MLCGLLIEKLGKFGMFSIINVSFGHLELLFFSCLFIIEEQNENFNSSFHPCVRSLLRNTTFRDLNFNIAHTFHLNFCNSQGCIKKYTNMHVFLLMNKSRKKLISYTCKFNTFITQVIYIFFSYNNVKLL